MVFNLYPDSTIDINTKFTRTDGSEAGDVDLVIQVANKMKLYQFFPPSSIIPHNYRNKKFKIVMGDVKGSCQDTFAEKLQQFIKFYTEILSNINTTSNFFHRKPVSVIVFLYNSEDPVQVMNNLHEQLGNEIKIHGFPVVPIFCTSERLATWSYQVKFERLLKSTQILQAKNDEIKAKNDEIKKLKKQLSELERDEESQEVEEAVTGISKKRCCHS